MLTRLYVEALLADQEAADQVWELWDAGVIPGELAACLFVPIHLVANSLASDSRYRRHC